MNAAVRRENRATVNMKQITIDLRDDPACFTHHERTGGNIPRAQIEFPKPIEAAASDTRQIERGGAVAPDGLRDARHHAKVFAVAGEVGRMKSGAHERVADTRDARYLHALTVEGGAGTALGDEELIVKRRIDDADAQLVRPLVSNGNAEQGIRVREVRRAVERIDIPSLAGIAAANAAFFTNDRAARELFSQSFDDQALGSAVGIRDEIGAPSLMFAVERAMQVVQEQRARFARRFDRNIERIRHGGNA